MNSTDELQVPEDWEEWSPEEVPEPPSPPWSTAFHSDFFHAPQHLQPGTAMALQKEFEWGGIQWHVPAVYLCPEGLMVDVCGQLSGEDTSALQNITDDNALHPFHPAQLHLRLQAQCNGQLLRPCESSSRLWVPDAIHEDWESHWVLEHYDLNPAQAWKLERHCFRWLSGTPEALQELSLTFDAAPVHLPGKTFVVSSAGEKVRLTHPHSKQKYTLTVEELIPDMLTRPFPEDGMEYPSCYTRMTYRISPDLPDRAFFIRDTAPSDPLRPNTPPAGRMFLPESRESVAIALIGGADGPTVCTVGVPSPLAESLHAAASALRFAPVSRIAWQIVFLEKPHQPGTVVLMP